MSNLNDVRFTFSTPADEAISFDVVSFEMNESVSQLYRLVVELVSASTDADFANLLDQPDQTDTARHLTTALIQEGR